MVIQCSLKLVQFKIIIDEEKKTRQQFIWESNPIFLLLIKSNLTLQNWMAKSPYTNTHPPLWIRLWSCKSIHFTCLSIITTLIVIFRNTRDRSIRRYMITTHAYIDGKRFILFEWTGIQGYTLLLIIRRKNNLWVISKSRT